MKPPEWLRAGLIELLREDGISEEELGARADAHLANMRATTIWARAKDRRGPLGTGSIEFTAGGSPDPAELDRLIRRMAGRAGGRPPGQTTIVDDEQLAGEIRKMRRDRVRPTYTNIAARTGFTVAELRGYLAVAGGRKRSLREFLDSI